MFKLRYCVAGKHYTLKQVCHGEPTVNPHPPRFNPGDPYGRYRRLIKYGNVHKRGQEG